MSSSTRPSSASPVGILPGAADGGDVFEPGDFGGAALDFLAIAEFPRAAGAFEEEELAAGIAISASFGGFAMLFPVPVEGADVADERGDSGDGADEEMIFAAAGGVESEAALRGFTDGQRVSDLAFEKHGRRAP